MNSKIVLTTIVMLFCLIVNAQQHTISGYVIDNENKEPILGANVFVAGTYNGTVSNNFGYFVINVTNKNDSISASFVGYTTVSLPLNPNNDNYNIELTVSGHKIAEVNVLASKGRTNEVIKPLSISTKQIKLLPSVTGEADLMKAYQYLPGISRGAEGNNSIYVRGGSPDQNLILLDDVPLYYVNHIGGIVSIFDENAISNVEVYKSGFPARYGGRLSSVVDVRMKNGSLTKIGGEFSIGLISSKLHLNGPIVKDKISFMLTSRKSMTDFYMQPISHYSMGTDGYMKYSFYDINAKVNWKIDDKNRIYLSAYSGKDGSLMCAKFSSSDKDLRTQFMNIDPYTFEASIGNSWGNQLVCFRWNHIYNQKLFSNLTLASTKYFYANDASNSILTTDTGNFSEKYSYDFNSGLNDNMAKLDFDYFINNQSHLKFGASYTLHDFNTGELHNLYDINEEALSDSSMLWRNIDSQIDTVYGAEQISSNEIVAYIEGEFELYNKFHINTGLHCSAYLLSGESNFTIQPRFAMRYDLSGNNSLTASYVRMVQNLHMLSGSDTTPTDIWLPATKLAKSEYSDQVSFGYSQESNNGLFKLNAEGFYKSMNNLIDYKLGYNLTSTAENWYDKIEVNGKGWCYGLELLAEKVKGDFTGWIAYTLSKNMRQFEGINANVAFRYVYDRPNDLSVVANYRLSERITFSGTWEYSSGRRVTLGTAAYDNNTVYTHVDIPLHDPLVYNESEKYRHQFVEFRTETATIYGTKNNYRLPDFHKLNISAHFTKKKKKGERTWVVGIQNVYNRMNAYNIYYTTNDDGTFELNKITLFPIMPNFSYSFKF